MRQTPVGAYVNLQLVVCSLVGHEQPELVNRAKPLLEQRFYESIEPNITIRHPFLSLTGPSGAARVAWRG
jgi:hypothetical protein